MNSNSKDTDELLLRFQDWILIEVADGDVSWHTKRSYLSSTRGFFAWCATKGLDPIAIGEDDVKLFRAYLIKKGYKRGTIATKLSGVRRFYDAVRYWRYRSDHPAKKVRAKRDLTTMSDRVMAKYIDDREQFLNLWKRPSSFTVAGKRDRVLIRIMCYTGARVSEISALDLDDLVLGDKPQIVIRAGKGNKKRHVPLGDDDVSIIRGWLGARRPYSNMDNPAVFITLDNCTRGSRLGTRGIRSVVDKYLKVAGLKKPGTSCHGLRHSFATWLLDAGVPIEVIADLLGHSSVAITGIYAKVVDHRKYTPSEIFKSNLGENLQSVISKS